MTTTSSAVPQPAALRKRQLRHVIVYGQSLSTGFKGIPCFDQVNRFPRALMLDSTRQRPGGDNETPLDPTTIAALVPLAESLFTGGIGTQGETTLTGIASQLLEGTHDTLLLTGAGRGGYFIAQLKKGTQPFANLSILMSRAKFLAEAAGYEYATPIFVWLQGAQDDMGFSADMPNYNAIQEQLRLDLKAAAELVLGRALATFPLFIEQACYTLLMPNNQALDPKLDVAQLAAHEAGLAIITGPNYPYDTTLNTPQDGLHLSSDGYRRHGAMIGWAIRQHIYEKRPWSPVRPISITRVGSNVDVVYTGQEGALVLDTNAVKDPGDMGYVVKIAGGASAGFSSVSILNASTVRLVLKPGAPAGSTEISYAHGPIHVIAGPRTGPRGCLRDSFGIRSAFDPVDRLHKWACGFKKVAT